MEQFFEFLNLEAIAALIDPTRVWPGCPDLPFPAMVLKWILVIPLCCMASIFNFVLCFWPYKWMLKVWFSNSIRDDN